MNKTISHYGAQKRMKKFFTLCLVFCGVMQSIYASEDFFVPVRTSGLRAPAVPLLASDPFFSIWSPADCLYDRDAVHWSGSEKPLSGAVRVDGEVYRFMGEADSTVAALRPPVMFFRKADLVWQLKVWKRQAVSDVLELLYNCERQCKTTNMPAEECLSYTLMQIGGAARRLSR